MPDENDEDPYEFSYERVEEKPKAEEGPLDANSPVRGLFRRIEEAGEKASSLRPNHLVMFLGMLCPIIAEEANRVKIRHGNTELWIPKEQASKVLSGRVKEKKERWLSVFVSPSLPEEKK